MAHGQPLHPVRVRPWPGIVGLLVYSWCLVPLLQYALNSFSHSIALHLLARIPPPFRIMADVCSDRTATATPNLVHPDGPSYTPIAPLSLGYL